MGMMLTIPIYPASLYANTPANTATGGRVAAVARQMVGTSSYHGPDKGNLACAFMVNEVLYQATGRRFGKDPTTVNSVRMDFIQSGARRVPQHAAQPGDIAMVFNQASLQGVEGGTAHIGIVLGPNQIIANSSKTRRFDSWLTFQEFKELYSPYFEIYRLPNRNTRPI